MKFQWIFAVIAMIALAGVVSAEGIIIGISGQTVGAGSQAVIPVTVSGASALGGADLTVTYDPAVLKFVSAKAGALSKNGMIESDESAPGTIMIGVLDSQGMTGDGNIADLTFTVTGASGTTSPVGVEVRGAYTLEQVEVVSQVTSGTITVGAAGTGTAAGTKSPVNIVVVIGAVGIAGFALILMRKNS
jgi:hypothetical protein